MGTVLASSVIERAQTILQDTTGVRWPADSELLGWLNDGQREIVLLKPNAYVKHSAHRLVAGAKQALPDDGVQMIDVVCNLGIAGSMPGRAVRIVERSVLDAQVPNWYASAPAAEVKHYCYSPLDPKTFYVYPPQPVVNQGFVELVYGANPADATLTGAITLDDIYQNVLVDYVLYRAFSKESEAGDNQRASLHRGAFEAALNGKANGEAIVNPAA